MITLILAVLLTQTPPTQAEITGALNAIQAAWLDRANRTVAKAPVGAPTRACIRFAGNAAAPVGAVTIRASGVILSAQAQNALGLAGVATNPAAVMVEVQAVPSGTRTYNRWAIAQHLDVLEQPGGDPVEVEKRVAPVNALCEIGIVRLDDASATSSLNGLFRCACSTGSACKAADGVTAAPTGTALWPVEFTPSAACRSMPCVTRFETDPDPQGELVPVNRAWPAACPR